MAVRISKPDRKRSHVLGRCDQRVARAMALLSLSERITWTVIALATGLGTTGTRIATST